MRDSSLDAAVQLVAVDLPGLAQLFDDPPPVWTWQVTLTYAEFSELASIVELAPQDVRPTIVARVTGSYLPPDSYTLGRVARYVHAVDIAEEISITDAVDHVAFLREAASYGISVRWHQQDGWPNVESLEHLDGPYQGPDADRWHQEAARQWHCFVRNGPGFVSIWDRRPHMGEETRITIDEPELLATWRRAHDAVPAASVDLEALYDTGLLWSDDLSATVVVPRVRRWPIPAETL